MLNESNASSRRSALRQKMQSHWEDLSSLIVHADQPPIRFDPTISKKLHKPSKCYLTGFCVCAKAPSENIYTMRIADRLKTAMKKAFWSKGRGKDRKVSKPRELLESSQVVMALCPTEGQFEDGMWLHLGFVNYKTWAISTMQLLCAKVTPRRDRAWLQLIDIQASDVQFFLDQMDEADQESDDTLHNLGLNVRTLVEAVKANLHFQQSYTASFWKFAAEVSGDTSPLEEMLPCFLQVVPLAGAEQTLVWQGIAAEDKPSQQDGRLWHASRMILWPSPVFLVIRISITEYLEGRGELVSGLIRGLLGYRMGYSYKAYTKP